MPEPEPVPRRLNLGCGFDRREGYLNVDFQAFHEPDLVADIRHLDTLGSAEFDEIVAQDVLEHLERQDVDAALCEWARLLRPGGRLLLRVPDIIGVARLLCRHQDLDTQRTLIQNLFGTQAYTGDYHHAGFTEVTMRASLAAAGFEVESLVPRDEWMFDVVAVRADGPRPYEPGPLPFMRLAPDAPPPVPTGEDDRPSRLRRLAQFVPARMRPLARRVVGRLTRSP